MKRPADDKAPFAALVFKIMTDPFVGQLAFIRVYSGRLLAGDSVYVVAKGRKERVGRLLQDARQQAGRSQGSLCRRHRGGRRAEVGDHRRYDLRRARRR